LSDLTIEYDEDEDEDAQDDEGAPDDDEVVQFKIARWTRLSICGGSSGCAM
jgi:hypothetical protein